MLPEHYADDFERYLPVLLTEVLMGFPPGWTDIEPSETP
jgi:hypothetical protein